MATKPPTRKFHELSDSCAFPLIFWSQWWFLVASVSRVAIFYPVESEWQWLRNQTPGMSIAIPSATHMKPCKRGQPLIPLCKIWKRSHIGTTLRAFIGIRPLNISMSKIGQRTLFSISFSAKKVSFHGKNPASSSTILVLPGYPVTQTRLTQSGLFGLTYISWVSRIPSFFGDSDEPLLATMATNGDVKTGPFQGDMYLKMVYISLWYLKMVPGFLMVSINVHISLSHGEFPLK